MKRTLRIGLIGDHSSTVRAHGAIPLALGLAARGAPWEAAVEWLATPALERDAAQMLAGFDGLWCVPGSPYASMEGALRAIRFAREQGTPFLGTCGGFQHTLIEYARDVLGLLDADHAESNPQATLPLIAPLACSLVGERGVITLRPGSHIAAMYGSGETEEAYHCSFGLDPQYHALLAHEALRISGVDGNGEARVVELDGHPFFIGTLYQPELSAFAGNAHPLIGAFLRAAAENTPTSGTLAD